MKKTITKAKPHRPTNLLTELKRRFNIGKRISNGNGDVYLINGTNKLIKVVEIYPEEDKWGIKSFKRLALLKKINSPCVVKILEFGTFDIFSKEESIKNKCASCKKRKIPPKTSYYYYIMPKLNPLPRNYRSIVNFLYEFLDDSKKKFESLPFLSSKMNHFLKNESELRKLKLNYGDLHQDNIMLDDKNNFKLIDLESFY